MKRGAAVVPTLATLVVLALAGCGVPGNAAPTPQPTVTVTVVERVEVEPTPIPRSPSDALTEFDAWLLCLGAIFGNEATYPLLPNESESVLGGKTVQDNGDGTFMVIVPFGLTAGGSGGESYCDVGGTVGEPTLEMTGGRSFG
jgi:hypothetical protein